MNEKFARLRIPLFEEQIDLVTEAIRNGQLVYGDHLKLVETYLRNHFKYKYVVLVANGYSALFLALKSLQYKASNKITTVPISTCFAIQNAIQAAGCVASYRDIDPHTVSFVAESIDDPVVIVPSHFGVSSDFRRSDRNFVIEDACQAFLSRQRIRSHADVLICSFYASKIVNGIDGGAIMTDDEDFYKKAKSLVYYGDQFEHSINPRFNMKLNNVNAAFLLGTLRNIEKVKQRLDKIYEEYSRIMDKNGIEYVKARKGETLSRFLVVANSESQKLYLNSKLKNAGIPSSNELMHICPLTLRDRYPIASRLVDLSFSIPFDSVLSDDEISEVLSTLEGL